jgi:hypothetical protein
MSEGDKKSKTPIIILCFSIFIIGTSSWWFIQLFFNPDMLSNQINIFFTVTKLSVIVAGVGLIKMKKWGVYLYIIVYFISVISYFALPSNQGNAVRLSPMLLFVALIVVTSLLSIMFLKYRKRFH